MNIIAKGSLLYYSEKYPLAKTALLVWYSEILKKTFSNFNQLKAEYGSASIVANHRVVFNIKGNDYRLLVKINFVSRSVYIIWFGTHKEYDKTDVATIRFDKSISNNKK